MSTFQTLISLVMLVFGLSVIVQAVNEFIKRVLDTKAEAMRQVVDKFMGDYLPLNQVTAALGTRGLDIKALENMSKEEFGHLLDGIPLDIGELRGIVSSASATIEDIKNNIAASYDAARTSFQQIYTRKSKLFAAVASFLLVFILNANIIFLYEQVSVDQVVQQAIMGRAGVGMEQSKQTDLEKVYKESRDQINKILNDYPMLIRTSKYSDDFKNRPYSTIPGLLIMGFLVSLGAPFWNDILKGMTGINKTLNTNGKTTS